VTPPVLHLKGQTRPVSKQVALDRSTFSLGKFGRAVDAMGLPRGRGKTAGAHIDWLVDKEVVRRTGKGKMVGKFRLQKDQFPQRTKLMGVYMTRVQKC